MRFGILLFTACSAMAQTAGSYFIAGSPADVGTKTSAGFVLAGGGKDQDEAFRWLIRKAGGGDIVVLRASGGDGYNQYLRGLAAVDSVESFVIKTPEAAADPFAVRRIDNAEAVFIAGGDQWNYFRLWRHAPVGKALQAAIDRGVPVGGTSAGLAMLGQFVFTAEQDTVTSAQALADPFDPHVTVGRDFLAIPLLKGVITDTHFSRRDRMGRTLAFLARMLNDHQLPVARAIAVDERTAALVESDGKVFVVGEGAVYFIAAASQPQVCRAGVPLTLRDVSVFRVDRKGTFDVRAWRGQGGGAYRLSVEAGVVGSTQRDGSIY